MKVFIFVIFSLLTFNAFANEVYKCDFNGPDYILTFNNDVTITLQNSLKFYDCINGLEILPGTELELRTLLCSSKHKSLKFYITQYSDTEIILSQNVIFSKDISCKKL